MKALLAIVALFVATACIPARPAPATVTAASGPTLTQVSSATASPSTTPSGDTPPASATWTAGATETPTSTLPPPSTTPVPAQISEPPGPAPTLCPLATPELLAVDPLPLTTDQLSITVVVHIGRGEQVTVEAESGTFTVTGSFMGNGSPARVEVTLLPNTLHLLVVRATLARHIGLNDCPYGGYTLTTSQDRQGSPLQIEQRSP
jgi:hypothetical protein